MGISAADVALTAPSADCGLLLSDRPACLIILVRFPESPGCFFLGQGIPHQSRVATGRSRPWVGVSDSRSADDSQMCMTEGRTETDDRSPH